MEEDNEDDFEDIEAGRDQATAFRLRELLERLLADIDPEAIVEVRLSDDPQDDRKRVACRVVCHRDLLGRAVERCLDQLCVVSHQEYAAEHSARLQAVVPSMAGGNLAATAQRQQLFDVEICGRARPVTPPPTYLSVEPQTYSRRASGPEDQPTNYGRPRQDYRHVIALVHGIKDIGAWQATVSKELESEGSIVAQIRYGLYPAVRFLFPIQLARRPVEIVTQELANLRSEYPNARISVIAHSFGTYVLTQALRRDPNLKLWKVVLCGSVVDDLFGWAELKHKVGDGRRPTRDFIVNDCGTSDCWPILGASFGWHYGMAGSTGFSESMIHNRFHRGKDGKGGGHSLYFDNDFVRKAWRPFLIDDHAPGPGDGVQGEHLPRVIRWLYYGWVRGCCKLFMASVWLTLLALTLWLIVYSVRANSLS